MRIALGLEYDGSAFCGWQTQPSACGEHDFSAFRGSQCQSRSPIRNVMEVSIERDASLVAFTFRANAFLHHMIRNLVGSLVYVGAGREDPEWIGTLMTSRDRRLAAPTF